MNINQYIFLTQTRLVMHDSWHITERWQKESLIKQPLLFCVVISFFLFFNSPYIQDYTVTVTESKKKIQTKNRYNEWFYLGHQLYAYMMSGIRLETILSSWIFVALSAQMTVVCQQMYLFFYECIDLAQFFIEIITCCHFSLIFCTTQSHFITVSQLLHLVTWYKIFLKAIT